MTQSAPGGSKESDLAIALAAADAAARAVRRITHQPGKLDFKADADPVTHADRRSEEIILNYLADHRPDDLVVTEESTSDTPPIQGRVWLIDPLDGTTNYIHGFPWMAVSVALWIDNTPSVGVVVDITSGNQYTAAAGEGARCNGELLRVSETNHLGEALVVTGFPYNRAERTGICDTTFRRVLESAQGIRRLGAASLDMCMVASGGLDAYWEEDLSPWDMAAGVLIVEEAGGRATDQAGRRVGANTPFVAATNGLFHDQFLKTLNR